MEPFGRDDEQAVTALRVLAIDEVEHANSGHPGLPLGATPMAYVLWSRFLRFDPAAPAWPDRDRFVLSAGHGSAMLYALLHLFGYDLPLGELERFRQWGSRTPGHPEHGHTPGVETTTGPLGQGLATAVGMALAERHLAERFNRPGLEIIDHRTYVLASDGDLMEGISHEAASLAGHLGLGRLTVLYDDNHISIDGPTELSYSDVVAERFAGYGWHVLHVDDGNDLAAIAAAIEQARADETAPTLIRVRTHIGYGAPHKQDTADAHGSPLGHDEWVATRKALGWTIDEPFLIPAEIEAYITGTTERGRKQRAAWEELFSRYRDHEPEMAAELERRQAGALPTGWDDLEPDFGDAKALATRQASGKMINALAPHVPELIGGSADLTPSNDTAMAGEAAVAPGSFAGRYIHFGIREHAMAAMANGMVLHGGLRPYVGTFLIFSDYMRPSVRLAALMGQPVIFVYTHDSIGLGEDGPTHQPVEQLVALRIIPNLVLLRPADAHETVAAWRIALKRTQGPTALALSRQKLPILERPPSGAVERGAYVKREATNRAPDVVLVATGSEVALALSAAEKLEEAGVPTRVVSAPSLDLLAEQDDEYVRGVLGPRHVLKVAIEAGRGQGWHRWIGDGEMIVLSRFGASAPGDEVMRRLGFDTDTVVQRVARALARRQPRPMRMSIPRSLAEGHRDARQRLLDGDLPARLLAHDDGAWGQQHARSVSRRLGWLDLPTRSVADLDLYRRTAGGFAAAGARTLYLLGMGGSSLAPQVLEAVLGAPAGRTLEVLDTTDPERIGSVLDRFDPATSAVVAVSKSGSTAETTSLLEILWARAHQVLGPEAGRHFAVATEPGSALAGTAVERGFAAILPHPVDVGGRYSALSVVGLFPSIWLGHDADALLASGTAGLSRLDDDHPSVQLAALLATAAVDGWVRLAWCGSGPMQSLGAWAEQLFAESTGKEGKGVLPVLVDAPPPAEQAWPATVWLSVRRPGDDTTALDARLDAMENAGHPVVRWEISPSDLGQAFTVLEVATALVGGLLGVNPFDEPNVDLAKRQARAALEGGDTAYAPAPADPANALLEHIGRPDPLDVVVLLAYLPETAAVEADLKELAGALSARLRIPVEAAFGPRYLHSSGQLHKGGPNHVIPVVMTCEPTTDVAIPGQPYTLGTLRYAQALGDAGALGEAGRRTLHLHLGTDPVGAVQAMLAALRA